MKLDGDLSAAAEKMAHAICAVFDAAPSIYLYGSVASDDFRPGWSDIDILVLTEKQITEEQAETLVSLRQTMLAAEPETLRET